MNLQGSSRWEDYDEMIKVELMEGMVQLVARGVLLLDSKKGIVRNKSGKEFFRINDWKSRLSKLSNKERETFRFFDYREMAKRGA